VKTYQVTSHAGRLVRLRELEVAGLRHCRLCRGFGMVRTPLGYDVCPGCQGKGRNGPRSGPARP